MHNQESFQPGRAGRPPVPPDVSIDDFLDNQELYTLLQRLPLELRAHHLMRISDMSDEDAVTYLADVHERRKEALEESTVSDPTIQEYFAKHEKEIWHAIETEVFSDEGKLLGAGHTARVMRFELDDATEDFTIQFAVKYLLTPTSMTLSASGEHDLILEVERIQKIEQAEAAHLDETLHFSVPHPFFHHQSGKLQCYGMELIDGLDLERFLEGNTDTELKGAIRENLKGIDREALFREVDIFFDAMHTVCIHGDIKLANVMVSREGKFYVIDFGQSRLATDIDDKSQDSFRVKMEDEKTSMKVLLTHFLNKLEGN